MKLLTAVFFLLIATAFPLQSSAHHRPDADLQFFGSDKIIHVPNQNLTGGTSVQIADLGTDGSPEVVVGNGLGSEPRIRALRLDGSEIGNFLAYDEKMKAGVNVVVCDVNGDGQNEIVTAPQRGGGAHIRIFNRLGEAIDDGGFFAYKHFTGGINLTCGNLNDSPQDELVTLPAASGGPHVRVWNFETNEKLVTEFFAFEHTNTSGLTGTISAKKLFLAEQKTKTPHIRTYVIHNSPTIQNETQITLSQPGIASLFDLNGELHATTSYDARLINLVKGDVTHVHSQTGGVKGLAVDTNSDGNQELILSPAKPEFIETNEERRITVDVSEQRLYAHKNGILDNSFLISSGLSAATPLGTHTIDAKRPLVHYAWTYGPNHPENYDLGWIPYNLRFYPHIYLHYAPWHNNFGHKMSHGCVNVSLEDMKWLYDWSDEGVTVEVRE